MWNSKNIKQNFHYRDLKFLILHFKQTHSTFEPRDFLVSICSETKPIFALYVLDFVVSVNLTLSLVLLLCPTSSPRLYHLSHPVWAFGQADAHAADASDGFHLSLLYPATQGAAFHHLHTSCL